MESNAATGRKGELIAREHLVGKGYEVLHVNWRSGQKEVDIVAKQKNLLVFVEVKTRSSAQVMAPYQAVNRSKQKLIIAAAQAYIEKFGSGMEARFDVISIVSGKKASEIEHIEDAYRPYAR
jgi:putative endonuclease